MLIDLIKKEHILVGVEAEDWQEAIQKSAQSLLRVGAIEPRYIISMIDAVRELGPYIAIAPGVAIAHAKPESGVLRTAIALATLKSPVNFGSKANDPIHMVITLAAEDHDAHLNAMGDLVDILADEVCFRDILIAKTVDEVYALLARNKGAQV